MADPSIPHVIPSQISTLIECLENQTLGLQILREYGNLLRHLHYALVNVLACDPGRQTLTDDAFQRQKRRLDYSPEGVPAPKRHILHWDPAATVNQPEVGERSVTGLSDFSTSGFGAAFQPPEDMLPPSPQDQGQMPHAAPQETLPASVESMASFHAPAASGATYLLPPSIPSPSPFVQPSPRSPQALTLPSQNIHPLRQPPPPPSPNYQEPWSQAPAAPVGVPTPPLQEPVASPQSYAPGRPGSLSPDRQESDIANSLFCATMDTVFALSNAGDDGGFSSLPKLAERIVYLAPYQDCPVLRFTNSHAQPKSVTEKSFAEHVYNVFCAFWLLDRKSKFFNPQMYDPDTPTPPGRPATVSRFTMEYLQELEDIGKIFGPLSINQLDRKDITKGLRIGNSLQFLQSQFDPFPPRQGLHDVVFLIVGKLLKLRRATEIDCGVFATLCVGSRVPQWLATMGRFFHVTFDILCEFAVQFWDYSKVSNWTAAVYEAEVKEFLRAKLRSAEVELNTLQSTVEHLRASNQLLNLTPGSEVADG
ncbi:uncharacterized protein PV07_12816 [Cladophialophora immunda]|uniref:Uncharacterized protein n=1 Tax=Cladophialophora immunda TaxID=569365 RepID=A0A0D2CDW4_9EURO|nr:uncharacterized protein PV07_12816 [Cladophialophora immunda]KIW21754.1 hypothetical protein PV07_12816 [Cladophialophora immunda]